MTPRTGRVGGRVGRAATVALAAAAIVAGRSADASAQLPGSTVGGGVVMEAYRFQEPEAAGLRSLTLTTGLVSGTASLGGSVALSVDGRYARGRLERVDGSTAILSGLTDTRLVLSVPLGGWLTLSGVGVLPTGTSSLTTDELEVAGRVAADLLPFRVSHWGAGGGVGANVAATRYLGRVGMGVSVGYVLAGEFDPVSGEEIAYRPGDLFQVRAALDTPLGRSGKATIQGSLDLYGQDRVEGVQSYATGDRYQVMGSYAFPVRRRAQGLLYAGWQHRTASSSTSNLLPMPAQDLALFGMGFRAPVSRGTLVPDLDVRLFRRADGVGQGAYAGLGAALEWPAGTALIVPALKARFGSMSASGDERSPFYGFEARLGVRFGGRR